MIINTYVQVSYFPSMCVNNHLNSIFILLPLTLTSFSLAACVVMKRNITLHR